MALPLLGIAAPVLLSALRWFFLAKLAAIITRLFVTFGVALTSYKLIIEPLVNQAINAWQGLPSDIAAWVSAFGVDKCASIMLSAYLIVGTKKLFLSTRSEG